jgi:Tfp pilus assembly protein PilF
MGGFLAGCENRPVRGPAAKSPEAQSDAEYDLARDDFYKGNPRSALDHGLRAIELNDSNAKALYFTSSIYLYFCSLEEGLASRDCRIAEAERLARRAVKEDERFRDARNLLGAVLLLQGRCKDAIPVLAALAKDPAYAETHLAWGNLGWAQLQCGQVDESIASLRNSVTEPRFCVGHYRLGAAYEKKGDLAQAESSLTAALSVDNPECQRMQVAWDLRGRVRKKLGKESDASSDFEKCRELAAETPTGRGCARQLGAKAPPSN